MKRTITIIFMCAIFTVSAFAQSNQQKPATGQPAAKPADTKPADAKPAEPMPTVDEILNKYVQALGGKAAIEKNKTQVAKGTLEVETQGISAPLELYTAAPNKSLLVANIPGYGIVQEGYNGTVAWRQDPAAGISEKSGGELAAVKRNSDFYRVIRLKEAYSKMTVKGKEKVGQSEAYLIEAVPSEGSPEKMYFDTQSGLLLRTDVEADTPLGKLPFEIYFENYKEIDGVKAPFTVRRVSPATGNINIKLDEIKHNVTIDDAKFNKPAGQ